MPIYGELIVEGLEWGWYHAPEVKPPEYLAWYAKLEPDKDNLVHSIQELGIMKSKVRSELKWLSSERVTNRDPTSKDWLFDFAADFGQIFDILWSECALFPSATRIGEASHGIERWAHNWQQSYDWRDARLRYLLKNEHANRQERRITVYNGSEEEEKKKLKRAPKHNDRKVTQCQAGEQLLTNSARYSRYELASRFSPDELRCNSVRAVNKRGTTAQKKAHAEKMAAREVELRRKKLSKDGYEPISLEEYQRDAEEMVLAYDEQWMRERSPEAIVDRKIGELIKPPFWNQLTIDGGFFDEVKVVLPHFWEMVAKSAKGRRVTKKAVINGQPPLQVSLPEYLDKLKKLSKGELKATLGNLKLVTSVSHARELRRANISGRDLLLDLVQYDSSKVLAMKEMKKEEEHGLMRDVIKNVGTKHSDDRVWDVADMNIKLIESAYRHPTLEDPDPDDEEWLGPMDDDDDVPEPELERLSEG